MKPDLLRAKRLAVIDFIFLVAVLVINTLAATGHINHKTTAALSDEYPNYFVPAGQTFAIWGVIYLLLLLFCCYQFAIFFKGKRQDIITTEVNAASPLFLLTCIFNIAWIFSWHYEIVLLSIFIMLAFLITLIVMQKRLQIITYQKGWRNVLFLQLPFAIYLGWISIATIANATAVLVHYNWSGWGISSINWTISMMIVGALIALWMIFRRQNIFFAFVVIWAYYGIVIKRMDVDQIISIIRTAEILIGILTVSCIVQLFRRNR